MREIHLPGEDETPTGSAEMPQRSHTEIIAGDNRYQEGQAVARQGDDNESSGGLWDTLKNFASHLWEARRTKNQETEEPREYGGVFPELYPEYAEGWLARELQDLRRKQQE